MEQPLGRMATQADYTEACFELAEALGVAIRDWLGPDRTALFDLMVEHQVYPSREAYEGQEHVSVKWGRLTADVRVVQIYEHASRSDATAFAVVLAITSKVENGV